MTPSHRPVARGKLLEAGGRKLFPRGVTYGTFRPGREGDFPDLDVADADFEAMARHGVDSVRTFSVPSRALLDLAGEHGLRVLVGLPWQQHVAFLQERAQAAEIERLVRDGARACAGHPALLGFAIGNEIPASIVRWHGRGRVERFLRRLYDAAKDEDADALVTYANYPTTEYLELPFLDVVSFNVYLESVDRFEAYVARLQNVAGDRPLLLTEIGLDSRRHGRRSQAELVREQVKAAFAGGCAGAFVFSWTDEWHRGGVEVEDWDFGLTDRSRRPKPALSAAGEAFGEAPFPPGVPWPRVSVVVCTHNGAATLGECLAGVRALDYPDFEVIVVDDGSTDATAEIAASHDVRLIRTANEGLSAARNRGLAAATGEIVAYLDDDAFPDTHWLRYLVRTLVTSSHAGAGGPNLPPEDEGTVARCVARAPGGPVHVLLDDTLAEHVPGCNMAFRRDALLAVGGFDPRFRVAGDDVDVCWRLQRRGWTLGFSAAAVVWHRRRPSIRAYLRQQVGYGRAEGLLERKWPERYNSGGHPRWRGRVYGEAAGGRGRWRVHYGTWGSSPIQSLYERGSSPVALLASIPEWYLVLAALALLSAVELAAGPMTLATPLLGLPLTAVLLIVGTLLLVVDAARGTLGAARRARRREPAPALALTLVLSLLQPLARLGGRLEYGLSPWRRRAWHGFAVPRPRRGTLWTEHWREPAERLGDLEDALRPSVVALRRGGTFDRWDLEVASGSFGRTRLRLAVEEHGSGRQLLRYRVSPAPTPAALAVAGLLATFIAAAAIRHQQVVLGACVALAILVALRLLHDVAAGPRLVVDLLERQVLDTPAETALAEHPKALLQGAPPAEPAWTEVRA